MANPIINIPSGTGYIVVDFVTLNDRTVTAVSSGTNEIVNVSFGSGVGQGGKALSSVVSGTNPTVMAWDITGAGTFWQQIAVPLRLYVASSGTGNLPLLLVIEGYA